MTTLGIFPGKFMPLHRGHITSILKAHSKCDDLVVILSGRNSDEVSLNTRKKWLKQELQGFDHLRVAVVDESYIPAFPYGWKDWTILVKRALYGPNEYIETRDNRVKYIFGGENEYKDGYTKWFKDSQYILIDEKRSMWPVSGTLIRENPMKYWDYIVGAARPYYAKKILITGTESRGKTTMVKKLAKIFHTSWSEEVGRYYARDFLGGDETIFTSEDFIRIAYLQRESDLEALHHANKVCFFDTDAIVTQYYADLYLPCKLTIPQELIHINECDMIFYLGPQVKWVADGQRLFYKQEARERYNEKLLGMYYDAIRFSNPRLFKSLVYIDMPSYEERLDVAIRLINSIWWYKERGQ